MAWSSKFEKEYREKKEQLNKAGGEKRIEKEHQKGKYTARERLERLFDNGEFEEIEMMLESRIVMDGVYKKHYIGDGVIAAYGKVNGIDIYAISQDCTISGGAGGEAHVNKICDTLELAIKTRRPIVYLCDSGGARIEEGILSLSSYSRLFRLNTQASGFIPQIAAIMGNCAGGSSYSPAMCDFLFMVKNTSQCFITGPKVIKALTGEVISMNELGGVDVHSKCSGQAHFVCEDDEQCINKIKLLLDYICCLKKSYISNDVIRYTVLGKNIEDIVPENKKRAYDVKEVITRLVDDREFMEVLPEFAPNVVIGFSRLNGKTIGIVANQANYLGGALNCDASDKCARFVRTCDCYDIPILVLVDVPGFFPGQAEEKRGILRHGCKVLYAFAEASVPKVSLIMRKAYGGAYCAMNSKDLGADYVFAWPIAEIAVMGAGGAVDVIFSKKIAEADDPEKCREEEIQNYEKKYLNPYYVASKGKIDEIIMPEETRERIIRAFNTLEGKQNNCQFKKHGNIAL